MEIQEALDSASERRRLLWEGLTEAPNNGARAEVEQLSELIDSLWQELRAAKAHVKAGPRDIIIKRARAEDRFDREERRIRRIAA